MKQLLTLLIWATGFTPYAQDSTRLSLVDVIELAKDNHPIIRQAGLQDLLAEAEVLSARGNFDPKLESSYNFKEFKETTYYDKFHNTLKVPTWFPLDPKVEVYRNQGEYLSSENYVGGDTDYWQVTAGVSLPIGKGLFIDERRSVLKQAKMYGDIAEAEKIKLANKTLLNITKTYWEWYFYYQQYSFLERSMNIASEIFERVKVDFNYGEAAAVDTIQARINYLSRTTEFEKAKLDLTTARLGLSIHLWGANNTPLEITENTQPEISGDIWITPTDSTFRQLSTWSGANHPEIRKITTKQRQLEVQERWNKERLKPELNLSYSLIDAPFSSSGLETPQWQENYKLGMDFSFPLMLRKERGSLQKTRVYQEQMSFELSQTRQDVLAQLSATYAALMTNQRLTSQFSNLAENYERLLEAELLNLETGESDLFKLNIQQEKFIQAQVKYLEASVKLEKLKAQLAYDAGVPYLSYLNLYE